MIEAVCPHCNSQLRDSACPVCAARPVGVSSNPKSTEGDDANATVDLTAHHTANHTADYHPQPATHDTATAASDETLTLPGYDILGTLGRGGMGVVYHARQLALDRVVALKLVRSGSTLDAEQRERFTIEGRALARIQHPNIVQVFEVGEHAGTPFFTLEYLAGGSLAGYLKKRGTFSPFAAARLVQALADAMSAAHNAGILHRDLKPANVLLAGTNEDNLQPKITDFGLAKWLDRADGPTVSGAVMGTPSYMAPEQATGEIERISAATDVYALGATLYECLVGQPPFRAESSLATMALVIRAEPTPPRQLRNNIPAELEAICLKCLEKSPANRYATAAELRDDLGRFLRSESTIARPLTRPQRVWRAVRKRRSAVFAGIGAITLSVAVAGVVWALRPEPPAPPGAPDPDQPLRELEAELAAGKPVTLVGESGLPRWSRWPYYPSTLTESVSDVKPIASFQTGDISLLELVQNPPATGYRIEAELRQDRLLSANDSGANIGIYWQYRQETLPNGTATHRFYSLEFNETWGAFEAPEARAKKPILLKDGKPHGHHAQCSERVCMQIPGEGHARTFGSGMSSFLFDPKVSFPGSWRGVRIEVKPEQTRVEWRNDKGEYELVSTITAAMVQRAAVSANRPLPNVQLNANPRPLSSPMGIIATRSMVSFRNVRIVPLKP